MMRFVLQLLRCTSLRICSYFGERSIMWRALIFLCLIGFSKCKITDVRLVDGLSKYEGRVEVLYSSPVFGDSWGTVCDDRWTLETANLVCRQLGLPAAVAAPKLAYFGRGDENSEIHRVDCDGSESSLSECQDVEDITTCNHGEDAGVVCGNPTVTNIKLTNWTGVFVSPGYPNHMERAHYEWTFHPPASYEIAVICIEYFDIRHRFGATAESNAYVEDAKGVQRTFKRKAKECVHLKDNPGKVVFKSPLSSPKGQRRGFVARYVIIDKATNEYSCKDWDIHADGGDGKIEVDWKPPKNFAESDYTYIIAYNSTPSILGIEITNLSTVHIDYLDPNTKYTVHVLGLPLTQKPGMKWHYCAKEVYTSNLKTRLLGRKEYYEGYVEVYDKGQWIDVCKDYQWDENEAYVACRSMGMKIRLPLIEYFDDDGRKEVSKKTKIIDNRNQRNSRGLWFLKCSRRDKSLLDCPLMFKWTRPCRRNVPLVCKPVPKWRLQHGQSPREGIVEVLHEGEWGAVCRNQRWMLEKWDLNAAKVLCRSLGMPPPPHIILDPLFRRKGYRKIWLERIECNGNEDNLADCQNMNGWGDRPCLQNMLLNAVCGDPEVTQMTVSNRAGVITSPGYPHSMPLSRHTWTFSPVRPNGKVILYLEEVNLQRGNMRHAGHSRLTVTDGSNDTLFSIQDKKMRFDKVLVVSGIAKVTFYSSVTFKVNGGEQVGMKLHYAIVDEACSKDFNLELKTKPGMIIAEWSPPKKSHEYTYVVSYIRGNETSKTLRKSNSTSATLNVFPDQTYSFSVLAIPKDDKNDFFFCTKDIHTDKETIRLTRPNGNAPFEGIVELFLDNQWGTICANHWTLTEASVVCRSLGLPEATFARELFGSRAQKKLIRGVVCKGKESSITDCRFIRRSWCIDYNAAVVCGDPPVQKIDITSNYGTLSSQGFPDEMHPGHIIWTVNPSASKNARVLLYLEKSNLYMNRGNASLTIEDGSKTRIYQVKNREIEKQFIEASTPIKIKYYSSFISDDVDDIGIKIRYLLLTDSVGCGKDWNVSTQGLSGEIIVKPGTLDKSGKSSGYIIRYTSTRNNKTEIVKSDGSARLRWLSPNTLYAVDVFGYTSKNLPYRYCAKKVRTRKATFSLATSKFKNEGVVQIDYYGKKGNICPNPWNIENGQVMCRSLGFKPASAVFRYRMSEYLYGKTFVRYVRCSGSEASISDCSGTDWMYHESRKSYCRYVAGVVCGPPKDYRVEIKNLTGEITTPGFPLALEQAHYEWKFQPPLSDANVLLCILNMDLRRLSTPRTSLLVEDNKGKRLFYAANKIFRERIHVLMEDVPGKMVFHSPLSTKYSKFYYMKKGLKMRYFVYNDSCEGDWNDLKIQNDSGSIQLSWTPYHPNTKKAVVYYTDKRHINSESSNKAEFKLGGLNPDSVYKIHIFEFVPGNGDMKFCIKRVRTSKVQWRLTGGVSPNEGKVELKYRGQWGGVCGDSLWDLEDATVVCRSLGLPNATYAPRFRMFGKYHRATWMKNLRCKGTEKDLGKCEHGGWNTQYCYYPANVVCGGLPEEKQINITNKFGVIKNPGFPSKMSMANIQWVFFATSEETKLLLDFEAAFFIRAYGYSSVVVETGNRSVLLDVRDAKLDENKRRFVIDSFPVKITYKSSFSYKLYGSNEGLKINYVFFNGNCSDSRIKVQGGTGKLDVMWTELKNNFDFQYFIQYSSKSNESKTAISKTSSLPYTLDNNLPPDTLFEVTVLAVPGVNSANYSVEFCSRQETHTSNKTNRLAGGRAPTEGRVELFIAKEQKWMTICADNWNSQNGIVACRSIGLPPPTKIFDFSPFPKKMKTFIRPLNCSGEEESLLDCPETHTHRVGYCRSEGYPASLICGKPLECKKTIKDKLNGRLGIDPYFQSRKTLDCKWEITAPSSTDLIVLRVYYISLSWKSKCRESFISFIDGGGKEIQRNCANSRMSGVTVIAFGALNIRLQSGKAWWRADFSASYHMIGSKLNKYQIEPSWNVSVDSTSEESLNVKWAKFPKSRSLKTVVKYVAVCINMRDDKDIFVKNKDTRASSAQFSNMKPGNYTVYVVAFFKELTYISSADWPKVIRRSAGVEVQIQATASAQFKFLRESFVIIYTRGQMFNVDCTTTDPNAQTSLYYRKLSSEPWKMIANQSGPLFTVEADVAKNLRKVQCRATNGDGNSIKWSNKNGNVHSKQS